MILNNAMDNSKDKPDDVSTVRIISHVLIRDVESGEVLVNQRYDSKQQKEEKTDGR